jgi:hypothetical protein
MNTIEERLWNYVDGTCTEAERRAIDELIANDEAYRNKFDELLGLDKQFSKMDLDEPSMAFTYNVMEGIRAEFAQKPLKAAINKRIIRGISIFFIVTILAMVILMLSTFHPTHASVSVHLPDSLKLPDMKNFPGGGMVVKLFIFFDVVLGLFLADAYLRKKKLSKQV